MSQSPKNAAFLVNLTVAGAALLGSLPASSQAAVPAAPQAQIQSVSLPSNAVITPAAPVNGDLSPVEHYSHSSHSSHSSHYSGR
jgi:hypothetical protein